MRLPMQKSAIVKFKYFVITLVILLFFQVVSACSTFLTSANETNEEIQQSSVRAIAKHTVDKSLAGAFGVHGVDLDGDGDLDILGAARDEDWVVWYENDGSQNFTKQSVSERRAFDGPRTVQAADFDGDGDLDVVSAALEGGEVAWWSNDGSQSFEKQEISGAGNTPAARSVFPADVDQDDDIDVIVSVRDANEVVWFENNGLGEFTRQTVSGTNTFEGAYWVHAIDLDQDKDLDVLGIARYADEIAWFENDGAGKFTKREISGIGTFEGARAFYPADFDADGYIDVVGVAGDAGQISWWKNDGQQDFERRDITEPAAFEGARSVTAADIDSDGDIDVIGAAREGSEVAWWSNNGNGEFTKRQISSVAGDVDGPYGSYIADIDSDGDLDVLAADQFDNDIVWWEMQNSSIQLQ